MTKMQHDFFELIQNENSALKSENIFLKERIETMANTLSELNNKVKVANQEKGSLVTAIWLIYDDAKTTLSDKDADQEVCVSSPDKRKQSTTRRCMLTTAVATSLGINQYSPLSVKEVPYSDNYNDDNNNITNPTRVTKPTTQLYGSQSRCKHWSWYTDTKDQHRPRHKGGSKPTRQDPKSQQNRDDNIAVVGDSISWNSSIHEE